MLAPVDSVGTRHVCWMPENGPHIRFSPIAGPEIDNSNGHFIRDKNIAYESAWSGAGNRSCDRHRFPGGPFPIRVIHHGNGCGFKRIRLIGIEPLGFQLFDHLGVGKSFHSGIHST